MNAEIKDKIELVENEKNYTNGLLQIGEHIAGYVITEKFVTSSGEAELYLCEKNAKKYVLKYYFRTTFFSDLAKKLTSIEHKNVMKIYSCGEYKKHSYEIDEYYEGNSLDTFLPLKETDAFKIFGQINEGLKAIHDAGILHRDIKAENIYFKDKTKKEIVIGDFGIATLYDKKDNINEHLTKINAGTDGYKAPESFNGVVSPAIDYYSFGIMCWNILTGKEPFVEDSGEAFSAPRIRFETIQDKIKPYLLDNAFDLAGNPLSEKSKKLISGLLVYRHDQRWRYKEVKDFLAGKEINVFEEQRELSSFLFCGKELFTLKSIAEEFLQNLKEAYKTINGIELTRYLDKNDLPKITDQVEKIQKEFLSEKTMGESHGGIFDENDSDEIRENYVVIKVAYALDCNVAFPLTYFGETYYINTIADFIDLLDQHPIAVRPYLKKQSYGFYIKLECLSSDATENSLAKWIKDFSDNTKNDGTLCASLYLMMMNNKITPFSDKINANIVLEKRDDVLNLEAHLKDRLMFLIDAKDKYVIAWFENVFGCNMDDWYGELEGGYNHDEDIAQYRRNKILAYGKWRYFELFLKKQDVIFRKGFNQDGKYGFLNLDENEELEELRGSRFDDIHCKFIRGHFIVKAENDWHVYTKETFEDGIMKSIYKSVLTYPYEICVLDEEEKLYFAEDKDGSTNLFFEGDENSPYIPFIASSQGFFHINPFSEINHPNECFVNEMQNGDVQLLDKNYKVLDSYEKLQPIQYDVSIPKTLIFWAVKNNQVLIIDKNATVLANFPDYTDFDYVGNNCFIVIDKEGKKNVVDCENNLIKENVDYFMSSFGIAATKNKYKKKWELKILLKNIDWTFNDAKFKFVGYLGQSLLVTNNNREYICFNQKKGEITQTTIKISGKGGLVQNDKGVTKKFTALNSATFKKACENANNSQNHFYDILGFDGKMFYKYNFDTSDFTEIFTKRNIQNEEFEDLMNNVNAKIVMKSVNTFIKMSDYEKTNRMINLTWEYYYEKNYFAVSRYLLKAIRMDKMAGFEKPFLFYKNRLAHTFINENEILKKSTKKKDKKTMRYNYFFALGCFLSSAGRETEKNKIVIAPYYRSLQISPELMLDCTEQCILISQADEVRFSAEKRKDLVENMHSMLESLASYYAENITDQTYFQLCKIGELFVSLDDTKTAKETFLCGLKYEPDFNPINRINLMYLYYQIKEYKDALSLFENLKKVNPRLMDESEFHKLARECKKHLGI